MLDAWAGALPGFLGASRVHRELPWAEDAGQLADPAAAAARWAGPELASDFAAGPAPGIRAVVRSAEQSRGVLVPLVPPEVPDEPPQQAVLTPQMAGVEEPIQLELPPLPPAEVVQLPRRGAVPAPGSRPRASELQVAVPVELQLVWAPAQLEAPDADPCFPG